MRAAAIDVGTNSVKSCVGEKDGDGNVRILDEASDNPRLGEGFAETHELQSEAIDRAVKAIGRQVQLARHFNADLIRVVGTSAARDAVNRDVLIERIRHETGIDFETASEYDEARLSYLAVALDPKLGVFGGNQLVVDVGGGSTEFIYGSGAEMDFTISVRAGAVRLTEKFLKGDRQTICQLVDAGTMAEHLIRGVARKAGIERLVGVGGSIINIARVCRGVSPDKTDQVHGIEMSYTEIRGVMNTLLTRSIAERRDLVGLEPERADIILGGAVIIDRILALFEMEHMVVCTRGLRHGLLNEMLS